VRGKKVAEDKRCNWIALTRRQRARLFRCWSLDTATI